MICVQKLLFTGERFFNFRAKFCVLFDEGMNVLPTLTRISMVLLNFKLNLTAPRHWKIELAEAIKGVTSMGAT